MYHAFVCLLLLEYKEVKLYNDVRLYGHATRIPDSREILGELSACANTVCQALFPSPLEKDEANVHVHVHLTCVCSHFRPRLGDSLGKVVVAGVAYFILALIDGVVRARMVS